MGPSENLEIRRCSLAMLAPGSPSGLSREDALALIAQLQRAQGRIVDLERDLHAAVVRHPASGRLTP